MGATAYEEGVVMVRLLAYLPTAGGLTGAPRRLLTLAAALRAEGVEVVIASEAHCELLEVARMRGERTASIELVAGLGLRHRRLLDCGVLCRVRVLMALVRHHIRVIRCIRCQRAEAVWIRGSKGVAFGAVGALLSGRPLIWDVDYELPSRGVVRWLHRLGIWASRIVVFQYSAAPAAIFGHGLAARNRVKFRTIIPGVEMEPLDKFRAMRERLDRTERHRFVILHVGTICRRKNQGVIVDAMAKLKQRAPTRGVEVWFAGEVFEEAYTAALEKEVLAHDLSDMVNFMGWRADVHELMAAADLLVMPSRDEGIPNAVQEAMAIGLPVAVSAAGGMPEIVKHNDTGWIVDSNSVTDWAERLQWCVDNVAECEAVGRRGFIYALQRFGTEKWGEEYARVIAEVVGQERGSTGA